MWAGLRNLVFWDYIHLFGCWIYCYAESGQFLIVKDFEFLCGIKGRSKKNAGFYRIRVGSFLKHAKGSDTGYEPAGREETILNSEL